MSYIAPSIVELGTLVTSTLKISSVTQQVTKSTVSNTDTGYLATFLPPGTGPYSG